MKLSRATKELARIEGLQRSRAKDCTRLLTEPSGSAHDLFSKARAWSVTTGESIVLGEVQAVLEYYSERGMETPDLALARAMLSAARTSQPSGSYDAEAYAEGIRNGLSLVSHLIPTDTL